jgi:hypothetical protein
MAYYLTYRLKKAGFRVEFVGEAAREEHIYDAAPGSVAPPLLDNQVLLAGQQYERVLRLKRHSFEVAICDSPLIQGILYCQGHFYAKNLQRTIRNLENEFDTYNIFIRPRPGSYDPESRVQRTEAEARALDKDVKKLIKKFWMEVGWDDEEKVADAVIKLAASER